MGMLQLLGLDHESSAGETLARLRDGRAGIPLRLGLTLASAAFTIGICVLSLAVLNVAGVNVEHQSFMIPTLGVGVAIWCGILLVLWGGMRRWRKYVRMTLTLVMVGAITIFTCGILMALISRREAQMFVAATLILGIATALLIVSLTIFGTRGKPVQLPSGLLDVTCPGCGYSMVGLSDCQCPECGVSYTIDTLITAQEYIPVMESPRPALPGTVTSTEPGQDDHEAMELA